jgi:16S rRNA (adenine1518-N6/adenine1519-N6)-dimethyltransferase
MQTKQDIERLLAGAGTQPKHRLGQNFLIDLNLMRLLIEAAHLNERDVVLEVGTGTGSFSQGIAEQCGHLVTVEFDTALFNIARTQFEKFSNITQFNMDILENKNTLQKEVLDALLSARDEFGGRLLLVANLPYNVGSSVMANLISGPVAADGMYVTIQKEVADRMAASPCNADYGTLSIRPGPRSNRQWSASSAIPRRSRKSMTCRPFAKSSICSWAIDARWSRPASNSPKAIWKRSGTGTMSSKRPW